MMARTFIENDWAFKRMFLNKENYEKTTKAQKY